MTENLTMEELGAAVNRGEREPSEVVARLKAMVVYPRFIGVDDGGSYVWELENGRWTWGDEPYFAWTATRTFDPEDYVAKYGTPTPLLTLGQLAAGS